MKVSVCITAYNQEDYIVQAVQSVLSQKTNFDYEIIIGEDDSSDRTREILINLAENNRDKIKLLLNSRSSVVYIDGKPTGRWNLVNVISHAKGEYIALLDGDDFWVNDEKLQKQVDFLEVNRQCSVCFHNAVEYIPETDSSNVFLPDNFPQITTLSELLEYNFIPTCTVMYRKSAMQPFPPWFYKIRMGDWPLHMLTSQNGDIGYLNLVMGCYRQHSRGSWYSMPLLQKYLYISKAYEIIQQHFRANVVLRKKINTLRGRHFSLIATEYKRLKRPLKYLSYCALARIYNSSVVDLIVRRKD